MPQTLSTDVRFWLTCNSVSWRQTPLCSIVPLHLSLASARPKVKATGTPAFLVVDVGHKFFLGFPFTSLLVTARSCAHENTPIFSEEIREDLDFPNAIGLGYNDIHMLVDLWTPIY